PLLQACEIKATFFPESDKVNTEGYMNWTEINELSNQQHFIGAKEGKHDHLSKMNPNELIVFLENSRRTMRNKSEQRVNEFSLLSGKVSNRILEFIEIAGFSNVLTNKAKINIDTEQFVLHRHRINGKMGFTEFSKLIQ
ncbi:unnamed protein product, partial [Chrysoparadoxa australica]